jgi:hypothetical protein
VVSPADVVMIPMPLDVSVAGYRARHPEGEARVRKAEQDDAEGDRAKRILELRDYAAMMAGLGKHHLAARACEAAERLLNNVTSGPLKGVGDPYEAAMRRAAGKRKRAVDGR